MRRQISLLAVSLISGTPLMADAPAAQIRALYEAVPESRVRASPRADILSHIEQMAQGRAAGAETLAVPELDIELLLRQLGDADVLMEPRVLEAIARMPPSRAAEVLRLIEAHRSGRNPVSDVPPLSLSEETESLPLRGWVLSRDENGAPYIQNGDDPASRLLILPSMILGDMGRIVSIQDDESAFRVTLETGDTLEGEVRVLPVEPSAEIAAGEADAPPEISSGPAPAPASSLRPRPRPTGLVGATAPQPAQPDATQVSATAVPGDAITRSRPRARPEGLGG
jgi:hypothetical protein